MLKFVITKSFCTTLFRISLNFNAQLVIQVSLGAYIMLIQKVDIFISIPKENIYLSTHKHAFKKFIQTLNVFQCTICVTTRHIYRNIYNVAFKRGTLLLRFRFSRKFSKCN